MMTVNYYDVLFGYVDEFDDESTTLYNEYEVTDFILTHSSGYITEDDGTLLLTFINGEIDYCNDMRYRAILIQELRKSEGFERNNKPDK